MAVQGSTRRLDVLAKPKPLPADYFEDRRSVYWVDRIPYGPVNGYTPFATTPRVDQLSAPKPDHSRHADRTLDELPLVNQNALKGEATGWVINLANPKSYSAYTFERSVFTEVAPGAKKASPSPRIDVLSGSKNARLQPLPVYSMGYICNPIAPVEDSAKKGNCTPRVETLAESKGLPKGYHLEKPVRWPVLPSVKNASATQRLQLLARPKSSKGDTRDYDPYKVPLSALRAQPNPRIDELSSPLPRKTRTKKV